MPPSQHSEKVRALAIETYEREGLNSAARTLEGIVSRSAIRRFAREAGAKPPSIEKKRKLRVRKDHVFLKAKRLRLNDQLFARIVKMLKLRGDRLTANELRNLVISYAVLVEKRRLEEGADVQAEPGLTPEEILEEGERRALHMKKEHEKSYPKQESARKRALVADINEERARRSEAGHGT